MNGVASWYILLLALDHLFDFIACVSILSMFFSVLFLDFCEFYYLLGYWGSFGDTYNKAMEFFVGS